MSRLLGVLVIFLSLFLPQSYGQASRPSLMAKKTERKGVGLVIGRPTGLTGKYWVSETEAYDASLAWTTLGRGSLFFSADYLLHEFHLVKVNKGKLPLYYGLGGYVSLSKKDYLGVRVPLGVNFLFPDRPIGVFFEMVPSVGLFPSTTFNMGFGIGGRYYF